MDRYRAEIISLPRSPVKGLDRKRRKGRPARKRRETGGPGGAPPRYLWAITISTRRFLDLLPGSCGWNSP
jgi:hypothetical protein